MVLWYVGRDSLLRQASLLVYAASLVLMFAANGTNHLVRCGPRVGLLLRQLNPSSLYLRIVGTDTPICLRLFDGFWQWGIPAIIGSMALLGIVVKLFVLHAPRWVTAAAYLLMGWLSLVAVPAMRRAMPVGAWHGSFSVGFASPQERPPTSRRNRTGLPGFSDSEVWKVFAIVGCFSHVIVIAAFVAPHAAAL